MGKPDLLVGGNSIHDTQQVYTASIGLDPGTVGFLSGRSYVWCSYSGSTALIRGEPLVASELNMTTQNMAVTTNGLAIGQTKIVGITAGGAAIVANAFNFGLMAVVDGGGEGNIYEIDQNLAFTASTADGAVALKDPIAVASDVDTEVTLIQNKYINPQQSNRFGENSFVGVPNVAVPVGSTTTQHFWAQRTGFCPVFVNGEAKKGTAVIVSKDEDGRLQGMTLDQDVTESLGGGAKHVVDFDTTQIVGVMVTDAIDGEVQIVDLQNTLT